MISREEIIDVIRLYPQIMDAIDERLRSMNEEYQCLNQSIYRYAAYKSTVYGSVGYSGAKSDLSDMIKIKSHQEQEYCDELKKAILDLTEKADNVRRLHLCYMVLPYKYHELLRMLYQDKVGWGKVSEALDISISTLSRWREEDFSMIRTAYESKLSYTEILHLQKLQKGMTWDQLMKDYKNIRKKKDQSDR